MASDRVPGITSTPAANQRVSHNGKEYTTIKEGLAHILIPAEASAVPQTIPRGENQPQSVFYNPIQQFNRDLSVLAIKAFGGEVVERKRKEIMKTRHVQAEKRAQKKRKRAEKLEEGPRKAGKVGNKASAAESEEDFSKDDVNAQLTIDKERAEREVAMDEGLSQPNRMEDIQEAHSKAHSNPPSGAEPTENETGASRHTNPAIHGAHETKGTIQAASTTPNSPLDPNINESVIEDPQESSSHPPSDEITPTFKILDALSATGLRAIRYAHEIPFATSIVANDLLPAATQSIKLNVLHNKLENKIKAVTGNALSHMYSLVGEECSDRGRPLPTRKYDVIDLDPYGTAAPFLDAAVQAVRDDGGLLCVTCTDPGVWASNGYPEKCYSLYGGLPMKGMHSHEAGLRLILHSIATSAARYGLAMEPLLSLSIDYYARVFVRIHKSAADVKFLSGKTMIAYNCDSGCGAWSTQMIAKNKIAPNKSGKGHFWKHTLALGPSGGESCAHCGTRTHIAGPMFGGPLHSPKFIQKILDGLDGASRDIYPTLDRIEGMLTVALEEDLPPLVEDPDSPTLPSKTKTYDPSAIDLYPFFFIPSVVSKVLHCVTPHENAIRGALRHLGYRVTRSHTKPGSIKTDAPWQIIWEVMREWVRQKAPIKEGALRSGTAGWNIMGLDKTNGKDEGTDTLKNNDTEANTKDEPEKLVENKKLNVVFDEGLGKEPKDPKGKLVRYQVNPRENWGPMNRAKRSS